MADKSETVQIHSAEQLINKRELHAVLVYRGRTFNAQLSLAGEFSVQSDDLMPIPPFLLWHGYVAMHTHAVEMRTGEKPKSSDPVQQLLVPATNDKSLILKASSAPKQLPEQIE